MKVLAISVRIPEDEKKGDQVLSFHRLSYLAQHHTIDLVCFGSAAQDSVALAKLESLGVSVQLINWSKLKGGMTMLMALCDRSLPLQCALYQSTAYQKAVQESISRFRPDAVYAVMIRSLVNLGPYGGPLFVDMVDSMGLNFSRWASTERGLKRFLLNRESRRVSEYEIAVAQRASRSFVVSAVDQQYIAHGKVETLPLGINNQHFRRKPDSSLDPVIVFTGNMNYKPNADAVLWFYLRCWNAVKAAVPNVRWVIAGSNPVPGVVALRSDPTITVTGRVPSLAAVINGSRVAIAPMQSGSGMQFKILEAMACGVPVVATSLGLGDIRAEPDRDILLADTAETFVQAVLTLLYSTELREKIGEAGMRYVNARHTWEALNAEFERATFKTLER